MGVFLFLVPVTAQAATTCSFAAGTATITFGAAGDSAAIVRSGSAINVNGAACGAATVNNTTDIAVAGVVTGGESVTVDLTGGPLVTGGTGTTAIDIAVGNLGGAAGDTLTIIGSSAAAPAGAADDVIAIEDAAGGTATDGEADLTDDGSFSDITWDGVSHLIVNTGAGDDTVDAGGYTATGVQVDAGDGDDYIVQTDGNDTLNGGLGSDFIDFSASAGPVVVNLAGSQSASGAGTDVISNFEDVVGTAGADVITGDANDNWILPGDGADVVTAAEGNDTVDFSDSNTAVTVDLNLSSQNTGRGTKTLTGFENVIGGGGNDTLTGTPGDNVLGDGGGGNDTIDGGAGFDIGDYSLSAGALTVDLGSTPQTITGAGNDTISNLEGVWGGDGNDSFKGSSGDNEFDGGAGFDTVDFSGAAAGVTVDLTGGTAEGDGSDTVTSMEGVIGSGFDDTIEGTYGATAAEANNTLNGGAGTDTLSYSQAPAGVTVDLSVVIAQNTGGGGTDTLSNFENVTGSAFNDSLTGTAGNNVLAGLAGDDTLNGGLGTDTADYSASAAAVNVNLLSGSATGDGTDSLTAIENVIGSDFNDTLAGDGGNNAIDGGAGVDTLSYQFAGLPIVVDLHIGLGTGQGTDLISNVENIKGSTLKDTILGNGQPNKLQGGQGDDQISGKGGSDVLGGSGGDDELLGGGGPDTLKGGPGDDVLSGGSGADKCKGGPGADSLKSC
jgi:Ca2+-binding RTX toxin-like protein